MFFFSFEQRPMASQDKQHWPVIFTNHYQPVLLKNCFYCEFKAVVYYSFLTVLSSKKVLTSQSIAMAVN